MKLQTFPSSLLTFQRLIFHPLNVNKGLDITMLAAGNFTKYLPNCFVATANPLANTIAIRLRTKVLVAEVDLV